MAEKLPGGEPAPGRVITISSGKGGVGKTTATANLGLALASLGKRVVVIDADIGLRNLDVILGLENRIVYDLVDIIEGRSKLRQSMIRHKQYDNLFLIPAAQTRDKSAVSPEDMVRLTDELRLDFDYVIIDSPAGIERGFRNALEPADEVLIVTNPEVSAVRDADRIIGIIEAAEKGPGKLILNRIKIDMVNRGEMLSADDVNDILGLQIIGIIPEDELVLSASNSGVPVTLHAGSPAGLAFANVARRLTGEDLPFMNLQEKRSLLSRIMGFLQGA